MSGLVIGIVGSESDGVSEAGETLIGAFAREGYFAVLSRDLGSQIRGAEVCCRLRVSTTPILSSGGPLDLAVVLDWADFAKLEGELPAGPGTLFVYDKRRGRPPPKSLAASPNLIAAPLSALARAGSELFEGKDLIVLGILSVWVGLSQKTLLDFLGARPAFSDSASCAGWQKVFAQGVDYAAKNPLPRDLVLEVPTERGNHRRVADGNEMCARAALFSGCKFFGGYPIAPATGIMRYLHSEIWKFGGSALQAEDAIAGAASALGATYAGVKAMTATSGPGFSLLSEVLSLASAVELPLVCVNVQRGGPATGMPTKQEQSDLFAAAFSAHGDVVRPVLAATGAADIFNVTVEAFNIAERYQTPVVLLSDQEIAQSKAVLEPVNPANFRIEGRLEPTGEQLKDYARFQITESGVSALSRPGIKGGNYLAAGLEHDERGSPSSDGQTHAAMNRKRLEKLHPLKERRDLFVMEGDPEAPIGLISWGNLATLALEATSIARNQGVKVKVLVPKLLYPISESIYSEFFSSLRRCVVVEQSQQGQLHRLIRMWTSVPSEFMSVSKSGANKILPQEIVQLIRAMEQPADARFSTHYCDLLNIL